MQTPSGIHILKELFQTTSQKQYTFALMKFPGEEEIKLFIGKSQYEKHNSLTTINNREVLYFAPYDFPEKNLLLTEVLISGNIRDANEILMQLKALPDLKQIENKPESKLIATYKAKYIRQIDKAVEVIKTGKLHKVVLSRMQEKIFPENLHPIDFYMRFRKDFPNAFCYFFYSPQTDIWTGASPEVLCNLTKGKLKTVSLAGTLPDSEEHQWSDKERDEQEIVTKYILSVLETAGLKHIKSSPPYTYRYGKIKHLKTDIEADFTTLSLLENVIKAMHPTPAVCGLPVAVAKQFIQETEGYDRGFYTGFIGMKSTTDDYRFYVNLRCANISQNSIRLFAGGGITEHSIAENEWNETEWKMETLGKYLN